MTAFPSPMGVQMFKFLCNYWFAGHVPSSRSTCGVLSGKVVFSLKRLQLADDTVLFKDDDEAKGPIIVELEIDFLSCHHKGTARQI